jgi:hypothetical protein
LEFKAAAAILARAGPAAPTARSGPAASTVDDHGEITALAAPLPAIVDDVGDVLEPGYFRRSLRERTRGCGSGRVLPRTTPGLRT